MATKLKIITDHADIVPAPQVPDFTPAPTRKRHAGWTAESSASSSSICRSPAMSGRRARSSGWPPAPPIG